MELPRVLENGTYSRVLHPLSCSMHLTLDPLSSVTMLLPEDDQIDNLEWVRIPTPDGEIGYYRVSSVSQDMDTGRKEVYLEHGACTLADVLIPEEKREVEKTETSAHGASTVEYPENMTAGIQALVSHILQKQGSSRWRAGTISTNQTIYIELGGMDCLAALTSIMRYIPSYQIEFKQNSESDWRVNIVLRSTTPVCEGRLSRNLRTCEVSRDTSDLVTRVYAEGITGGYLDSNTGRYGIHAVQQNLSDTLSEAQKFAIVSAYLSNHDHPTVSINIDAVELSQVTGLSIDRFTLGTACRISIPWLGITEDETIIEKRYQDPYRDPEQVSLTLANAKPDLIIAMAKVNNKTGGGGGGGGGGGAGAATQAENERKRYKTYFEQTDRYLKLLATDSQWDDLGNEHITAYGQIMVQSDQIDMVVQKTGVDGLGPNETLYTRINQTAEDIALIATEAELVEIEEEMEQAYQDAYDAAIEDGKTEEEAQAAGEAAKAQATIHAKAQAEFNVQAGQITSLVQKTGVNDLGQDETLYSKLTQTATDIRSEVSTSIGNVRSTISQTATEIRSEVSDVDGRVSTIQQTVNGINISGDTITIKGNTVNLGDYVLVTDLEADYATIADLDALRQHVYDLEAGHASFSTLDAGVGVFGAASVGGKGLSTSYLTAGSKSMEVFSPGTSVSLESSDFPHSHEVSCSASGSTVTVTVGAVQSGSGSASFDMADTEWYAGQVSAFKSAVSSALGNVSWGSGAEAHLDIGTKKVVVTEANAHISYPGGSGADIVAIGLGSFDVSTVLDAYADSIAQGVTISGAWSGSTYTAETSSGQSVSTSISVEQGSWSSGSVLVAATDGTANRASTLVNLPSVSSVTGSETSAGTFRITFTMGGKAITQTGVSINTSKSQAAGASNVTVDLSRTDAWTSGKRCYMTFKATGSNGATKSSTQYYDCSTIYDNGYSAGQSSVPDPSSVKVSSWGNPSWTAQGVSVTITLSNGNSYSHTYYE